jgi:hypothetical protein
MAPKKTIKKNAPSKSKATQAKGKENATSTAALQAAKKKNHLRKDSGSGMSYHAPNDSSTSMSRHLLSTPRIPHCFDQYKDF